MLKHFGNRDIAEILIPSLQQYRSPELFEALYRDAETLARWRGERRQKCRAQIAEYRPPAQARGGRAIRGDSGSAARSVRERLCELEGRRA